MPPRTPTARLLGKLILASTSPRRKELLAAAGIEFDVMPSIIEERQGEREPAEAFVRRIAREKALDVLSRLPSDSPQTVLGADTVVLVNGQTLGKPASVDDAAAMLRMLSGRKHQVLTAVCLLHSPASSSIRTRKQSEDIRIASTTVKFSPLAEEEIMEYVATGEPFDKAGAYAIQGRASRFVESIAGCYFNVVGLPVSLVYQMLTEMEYTLKGSQGTASL
ncbi:MAG: septum formation inhibitor Maf [Acidobacteria bacterium]|nr:septum formation inhibitor Maf [Acidobacteriota bacterium]